MDDEPIDVPDEPAPQSDWFLQFLVRMANDRTWELGLTLNVGGVTVMGTLIGGRAYFDLLAAAFATGLNPATDEEREAVRASMAQAGRIYPEARFDEREARGEDVYLRQQENYIHLKDARFVVGNAFVPASGPLLWRGRLSEVDGWALGTVSATP